MRLPPSTGPLSTDFQGSTSGRLTFNADDRATQYIALNVLPYIGELYKCRVGSTHLGTEAFHCFVLVNNGLYIIEAFNR